MRYPRALSTGFVFLLLASIPVSADNLVASGQFDEPIDVDAWSVSTKAGEASISFEPAPDVANCERSGSALLSTMASGEQDVEYSACAGDIVGGDTYAIGLDLFFPTGESAAQLRWGVTWYDGPDCTGNVIYDASAGPASYEPDWQTVEFWVSTFPETASGRVQIWVTSVDAGESLPLNVDRVFIRPAADVFADGFEMGEACRWSVESL